MNRITKFLFLFIACLFLNCLASAQPFIKNKGQLKDQTGAAAQAVQFYGKTNQGFQVQLRTNGYSYEFIRSQSKPDLHNAKWSCNHTNFSTESKLLIDRFDVEFLDANAACVIEAKQSSAHFNFYLNANLVETAAYDQVVYHNLYPGIDFEFIATPTDKQSFKYNVIVHPGADLSQVKMKVQGAALSVKNSQLLFEGKGMTVSEQIPVTYYEATHAPVPSVHFELVDNCIQFSGNYDHHQTLVIDPVSNLVWATYQGGTNTDVSFALAHDANDNVYMTGYTNSAANIATNGAHQFTLAGGVDVFLSKFTKNGQRVWTTYFGGPDADVAYALHVQQDGTCYLTGATTSSINITTPGVYQTNYGGGINDILVASFNSNGQRNWASYCGGNAHDVAQAITCDKNGNVYFSGHTESTSNIASQGAYKTVYNFNYDVCLIKFNALGQRIWGTYYGDSGIDETYGIATDQQRNVYITGGTTSISDISTPAAHQLNAGGGNDAFIAKFDSTGTALTWGTYIGGTANDAGIALEVSTGTLFIGGNTSSTNNIASASAQQPTTNSFDDTFLGAFTLAGARLWCTYIGGEDTDYLNDITSDGKSQILVCGATISASNISMSGAYQTTIASPGNYDAFFARFAPTGTKQLSTYFGGEGDDQAFGMTLDGMGRVYLTGQTTSTSQIATSSAFQNSLSAYQDVFLAKFCIPFQAPISTAKSSTLCSGSITLSTASGYSSYQWSNGLTINPIVVNIFALGNYTFAVQVKEGADCIGISDTSFISIRSCVGLDELSNASTKSIIVYPNPSDDQLSLEFLFEPQNNSMAFVYDYQGKLIQAQKLSANSRQNIALESFAPGIYLLVVQSGNQVHQTRFIKN